MRPVAEIMMMNFVTVAMDQIVNHAAKIRFMSGGKTGVPLTIRTMSGAGGGFGGQHSDMYEAGLAHVPGLKVVVPPKIGRASCRERAGQYVSISVVAVSLKKKGRRCKSNTENIQQ